jgi:hypothetical protein
VPTKETLVPLADRRLELRLTGEPLTGPLADRHPRERWIEPLATGLGDLLSVEPPMSVKLAPEVPRVLPAGRISVPGPPLPVRPLLDATHLRPPGCRARPSRRPGRTAGACPLDTPSARFPGSAIGAASPPALPGTGIRPARTTTGPASCLLRSSSGQAVWVTSRAVWRFSRAMAAAVLASTASAVVCQPMPTKVSSASTSVVSAVCWSTRSTAPARWSRDAAARVRRQAMRRCRSRVKVPV